MADNVSIITGSGASISTDQDAGGNQHQRVLMEFGVKDAPAGPTPVDAVSNQLPTVDQTVLLQLIRTLAALARPEHLDPTTNALRVNISNAGSAALTLAGVTTVTSITNSVALGSAAFDAKTSILWATERELWATAIRGRVT